MIETPGAVLGCDFVGNIVELGSNVIRFAKGDVVAGRFDLERQNQRSGRVQSVLRGRRSNIIPSSSEHIMRTCQHRSMASATAWLALFSNSCLALNRFQDKGTSVLTWGGSSKCWLVCDSARFDLRLGRSDNLQLKECRLSPLVRREARLRLQ